FIDDDVPEWIKGDYTKLNQILNNLISNAIKFTEEGSVSLDIYMQSQTKGQITLLFEVSDTGIGIPKDKLEHIFDPFHQASSSTSRKFGGTGLGLSIIKNMVELQKGKIEVESEEGKGSVFKMYLTFNKAPELIHNNPYVQNQQEISEYKIINDFKILYVEDVESNQLLIQCLCKEWGIELEMAKNGFEAIEKVQSYKPHLILMDLQMPGMDGYEATEKIRALPDEYYKSLPIIALTAEVSESSKALIKEVGMNDFLLKPIDTDEIYGKLSLYSNMHEKMMLDSKRKLLSDSVSFYNYVNFSKTEELYKNDTIGFIKLLNLLVREFEGYHVQILKAVKEKDPKGLSFVKHKVASTIQSFNLKELADLLVKIQHILSNEPNSINEKELLEECDNYFNEISNEFRIKIKDTSRIAKNG
ncbi:MAG: ATP-binding protein, partial [Bacteroidota bacterium]|nr:ATP-binding protein [Bacteroidota bacterium]